MREAATSAVLEEKAAMKLRPTVAEGHFDAVGPLVGQPEPLIFGQRRAVMWDLQHLQDIQ